jgi:hypothetical protein
MTHGIPFIEKGRDQVHINAIAGGQGNEEKKP